MGEDAGWRKAASVREAAGRFRDCRLMAGPTIMPPELNLVARPGRGPFGRAQYSPQVSVSRRWSQNCRFTTGPGSGKGGVCPLRSAFFSA